MMKGATSVCRGVVLLVSNLGDTDALGLGKLVARTLSHLYIRLYMHHEDGICPPASHGPASWPEAETAESVC